MNFRNCPRCGKAFAQVGTRTLCPQCVLDDERAFDAIRTYLQHHPLAGVTQVSDRTGVAETLVLQFLREGRLTLGKGVADSARCERCGASIQNGRLCDRCLSDLTRDVQRVTGTTPSRATEVPAAGSHSGRYHSDTTANRRRP